ncbi:hypothetical protein [Endozoicomonas sp.]|uniref:hypothetical protein n=1 Tax=Endozoicomonas sp. TaxID=1892382 RepID=UPI003D9B5C8C
MSNQATGFVEFIGCPFFSFFLKSRAIGLFDQLSYGVLGSSPIGDLGQQECLLDGVCCLIDVEQFLLTHGNTNLVINAPELNL